MNMCFGLLATQRDEHLRKAEENHYTVTAVDLDALLEDSMVRIFFVVSRTPWSGRMWTFG